MLTLKSGTGTSVNGPQEAIGCLIRVFGSVSRILTLPSSPAKQVLLALSCIRPSLSSLYLRILVVERSLRRQPHVLKPNGRCDQVYGTFIGGHLIPIRYGLPKLPGSNAATTTELPRAYHVIGTQTSQSLLCAPKTNERDSFVRRRQDEG